MDDDDRVLISLMQGEQRVIQLIQDYLLMEWLGNLLPSHNQQREKPPIVLVSWGSIFLNVEAS